VSVGRKMKVVVVRERAGSRGGGRGLLFKRMMDQMGAPLGKGARTTRVPETIAEGKGASAAKISK
jgi:hypothetical protein